MSSDISAIREQLLAVRQQSQAASESPLPSGSASPSLPALDADGVTWQPPQRADVAQALRQRSAMQSSQWPTPEERAAQGAVPETQPVEPINIHRYLQRLHGEAERINELYYQQEAAIRKFHNSVNGLSLILMKHPQAAMQVDQFCEIRDAALTTVIQDEHNRYVLTAIDLDLNLDQQQASETAANLRARAQAPQRQSNRSRRAGWFESWHQVSELWQILTTTIENQTQITPIDILMWCGGGIIGRLALQLALAAVPGLWPWVIGITIGAVALGLYRLLFAPRTDAAFIARLFLALLGLGIGGQL
ncbi:hypothetical protein [Halomicronema sp. CCY15110]|uniref:hypothetical protein n=1 Tax=Halomicronema sp. CCY15110 TaxID=2767773 RepID=UPI00194EAC70|nr:hypothetical protein [Halomicronema sp. CCY15110]